MDFLTIAQTIIIYVLRNIVPPIVGVVFVLIMGSWAVGLVRGILTTAARRARLKPALIDLTEAAIMGIGWVLIAAGILQALHLDQLAIAVGGSISLVALGIASAASGNLGDIIAGVFLASDPDFGNGFLIKTGDFEGMIEKIDLRKTRLRGDDGKLHVIPNKMIENAVWIVLKRPPEPPPAPRSVVPSLFGGRRRQQSSDHPDQAKPDEQT